MRSVVAALVGSFSTVAAGAAAAAPATSFDTPFARQALFGAAFAAPEASAAFAPGPGLYNGGFGEARYVPGLGVLRSASGQVASFSGGKDSVPYVDQIRFTTAGYDPLLGLALLRPGAPGFANGQNLDVAFIRNWPQAFSLDTGRLTLDVTPHAGVGYLAGGGRTAEAGALVRLQQSVMRAVGMGGGRLFLFAGATDRSVDLNLPHVQAAVGPDPDQGFVKESQLGLGFERGPVQASFGFSHQSLQLDAFGDESRVENRVGLNISIR